MTNLYKSIMKYALRSMCMLEGRINFTFQHHSIWQREESLCHLQQGHAIRATSNSRAANIQLHWLLILQQFKFKTPHLQGYLREWAKTPERPDWSLHTIIKPAVWRQTTHKSKLLSDDGAFSMQFHRNSNVLETQNHFKGCWNLTLS